MSTTLIILLIIIGLIALGLSGWIFKIIASVFEFIFDIIGKGCGVVLIIILFIAIITGLIIVIP